MSDDLLLLIGGYIALRALGEYENKIVPTIQRKGVELYETLHDDKAHARDLPGKQMTRAQLTDLVTKQGFPDPKLAVAIIYAESGGVPNALGDGGVSVGLFQINTRAHPSYSRDDMAIPAKNAAAAYKISKGGTDWTPWSTFKSLAYQKYYT